MEPKDLQLTMSFAPAQREKAPRHKRGELFLRGPIPMAWLSAASRASVRGSAFKIAIVLWFLSGLNGHVRSVKVRGKIIRMMGIKPNALYRGLVALEEAKLIEVDRHSGRSPWVTILEVQAIE